MSPKFVTSRTDFQLEVFLREGIAAARAGNKSLAQSLLFQVVEHDRNNEAGWLWLAEIDDDPERSIGYLRKILEMNPLNAQAEESLFHKQFQQGVALAIAGKTAEARKLLFEVSALHPENETLWIWLASLSLDITEAESFLRRGLKVNPEHPFARSWLEKIGPIDDVKGNSSRRKAEERITELLDDLYTSLQVKSGDENIVKQAENAFRELALAKEQAGQLEASLLEAESHLLKVSQQLSIVTEEKHALEERVIKLTETESWSQEIGAKWLEESDARKAAEHRIHELESELERAQIILKEAEVALATFNEKQENEPEDQTRFIREREAAENRERLALRAKEEAERKVQELEARITELEEGVKLEEEKYGELKDQTLLQQDVPDPIVSSSSPTIVEEPVTMEEPMKVEEPPSAGASFSDWTAPQPVRFGEVDTHPIFRRRLVPVVAGILLLIALYFVIMLLITFWSKISSN